MNIIVFDTETIGKVSQDLLNVGYKIVDLNIQKATYKTLVKRNYLTTNLINNVVYCLNDDFVGQEKYGYYLALLENKSIIKRSIPQMFKTMQNDLKKHKVLFGYAYNCNFDLDKFEKTSQKFGINNPLENTPVFDIWAYACDKICNTDAYKNWAKENNVFTESKAYISTSVESVCKYLYNNLDFKESHTALDDAENELYILVECVKYGSDITRPIKLNRFIPSEYLQNETIITPDGQVVKIEFLRKFTRDGKTTYKK